MIAINLISSDDNNNDHEIIICALFFMLPLIITATSPSTISLLFSKDSKGLLDLCPVKLTKITIKKSQYQSKPKDV